VTHYNQNAFLASVVSIATSAAATIGTALRKPALPTEQLNSAQSKSSDYLVYDQLKMEPDESEDAEDLIINAETSTQPQTDLLPSTPGIPSRPRLSNSITWEKSQTADLNSTDGLERSTVEGKVCPTCSTLF
jgi:hypothetical protein